MNVQMKYLFFVLDEFVNLIFLNTFVFIQNFLTFLKMPLSKKFKA